MKYGAANWSCYNHNYCSLINYSSTTIVRWSEDADNERWSDYMHCHTHWQAMWSGVQPSMSSLFTSHPASAQRYWTTSWCPCLQWENVNDKHFYFNRLECDSLLSGLHIEGGLLTVGSHSHPASLEQRLHDSNKLSMPRSCGLNNWHRYSYQLILS